MDLNDYLWNEGVDEYITTGKMLKEAKKIMGKNSRNEFINDRDLFDYQAKNNLLNLGWKTQRNEIEKNIPLIVKHMENSNSILDVGCCDGLKTVYYGLLFPDAKIAGVDISAECIKLAKEKAKKYGREIQFQEADMYNLDWSMQYDTVLATNIMYASTDTIDETTMWATGLWHKKAEDYMFFNLSKATKDRLIFSRHFETKKGIKKDSEILNSTAGEYGLELAEDFTIKYERDRETLFNKTFIYKKETKTKDL